MRRKKKPPRVDEDGVIVEWEVIQIYFDEILKHKVTVYRHAYSIAGLNPYSAR